MIILDTNVLGELVRPRPDPNVVHWVDRQIVSELATTAITAAEMALGTARLTDGRRKRQLDALNSAILERLAAVLPFSEHEAENYALVMGKRERLGRRIEPLDAQIVAIALSHHSVIATRNTKDFEDCDVELINPWAA